MHTFHSTGGIWSWPQFIYTVSGLLVCVSKGEPCMVPTTAEMDPSHTQAQTHGERDLQMVPLSDVVSCPYGTYTDAYMLVLERLN